MARPNKRTVDYFPHQVNHGKTLFILEQTWGNDGYSFWFKLLEQLGKTEFHFIDFTQIDAWEYFIAAAKIDSGTANSILDKLSTLNAIDKIAWGQKVVYSQNFCDGIFDAYRRRNNEEPNINRVYVYINEVLGVKLSALNLKVKETKEKKSKVNIPPKIEEVKSYCKERSNSIDVENFFDFYTSKGWMVGKNKMKDWKAAIRTWERNDAKKEDDSGPRGKKLNS